MPGTLEHASQLPYYRARWGSRWRGVRRPEQLVRLPTIDKAEAAEHCAQLVSRGVRLGTGVVSSGTTGGGGPLLLVPSSSAEADAAADFLSQWHDWTPTVTRAVAKGITLEVRTMHHGVPEGPPINGRLRMPWTYTHTAFRQFVQLLSRPSDGKRITSLVIGAGALLPLTAWMVEHEIDPSRFAVRLIGTNGFRVSAFWRKRLAELWKAELMDNFSLSEFATTAMECPDCGFHHWLTPPLLHEVLDVFTHAPLSQGVGELTLTGLFPFVQAMPLIRYRTGDLVEIGPRCRRANDRGFRPRGRITQTLLDRGVEGQPLLVSGQDVQGLLEGESAVARHPHPVERLGLVKNGDIGAVKYQLTRTGKKLLLEIELRFDPNVYPLEAEALQRKVSQQLHRVSQRLGALEREGRISFEVRTVVGGTLTAPWSKF